MQQRPFELPDWLKRTRPIEQARRPRLLTALAVFWIVSGSVTLTAGLTGLMGAQSYFTTSAIKSVLSLIAGALFVELGLGAWNGWPWSRWATVAIHALSVPYLLLQPFSPLAMVSVAWAALVVWYMTRPRVGAYYRPQRPPADGERLTPRSP
ncbi:MAG: hypothetical protein Q7T26_10840 [Dehalococcoidia bacterium]|nr:hypothetical protein [Dehalococcoidia bacterium]